MQAEEEDEQTLFAIEYGGIKWFVDTRKLERIIRKILGKTNVEISN